MKKEKKGKTDRDANASVQLAAGRYQSVAGFAATIGKSRVAVLNMIWSGKVDAVQIGRAWIVRLPDEIPM